MKKNNLTFWNRFIEIWKPSFVRKLLYEKNEGKSWGFWFLSNAILALVAVGVGYVFLMNWLVDFPQNVISQFDEIVVQLPDETQTTLDQLLSQAEIEVISGNLFTKNIPDPSIMVLNESTDQVEFYDSTQNIPESDFVVLVDSAEEKFDPSIVDSFANGMFLFSDKAITKKTDSAKAEIQEFDYFDIGFSGVINQTTVNEFVTELKQQLPPILAVFLFIGLYLFLAVFRLLSALVWGLVFWGIGSILKIKDWSFESSFMTVLHFKFITMIFFVIVLLSGVYFRGAIFLLFLILFGMNFWQMKSQT